MLGTNITKTITGTHLENELYDLPQICEVIVNYGDFSEFLALIFEENEKL